MANFSFTIKDLMSGNSDPFTREQMKGLSQPPKTSQSYAATNQFNPAAGSNLLSVADTLMGAPIYRPKSTQLDELQNSLTSLVPTSTAGAIGATSSSDPQGVISGALSTSTNYSKLGQQIQTTIINYALSFLGVPYVYGGSSPQGFDCSGFITYVFKHSNLKFPQSRPVAQDQYNFGEALIGNSVANLIPGDLVFFGTDANHIEHVGMFIGDDTMIDAPHSGAVVRKDSNFEAWNNPSYIAATRPLLKFGFGATPTTTSSSGGLAKTIISEATTGVAQSVVGAISDLGSAINDVKNLF